MIFEILTNASDESTGSILRLEDQHLNCWYDSSRLYSSVTHFPEIQSPNDDEYNL